MDGGLEVLCCTTLTVLGIWEMVVAGSKVLRINPPDPVATALLALFLKI